MDQADLIKRLRAAFSEEAAERLLSLRNSLVDMEKAKSIEDEQALLEIVFREAHSLKGASRAVDLRNVEALCQHLESVFSLLKNGDLLLKPELFDIFHNSVKLVDDIIQNGGENLKYKTSEIELMVMALDNIKENKISTVVFNNKKEVASPVSTKESDRGEAKSLCDFMDEIEVPNSNPLDEEKAVVHDSSVAEPELVNMENEETVSPVSEATPNATMGTGVRISTEKLDNLLLKTEELISLKLISKEQLNHIKGVTANHQSRGKQYSQIDSDIRYLKKMVNVESDTVNKDANKDRISRLLTFVDTMIDDHKTFSRELFDIAKIEQNNSHTLERMLDDFSDDVKSVAMLPLRSLFQIYPGMVRDVARSQNKHIELYVTGEEVEIDKRILEELQDPLTHIIRNSADHGIESVEVRKKGGKNENGTINLSVQQVEGNELEITISDDGGGINFSRVREKAVEEGLLNSSEAEITTENQLTSMIFQSGLSTSPIITELSGRGLGLAIVKERIESLGGHLSVNTAQGKGTTFALRIPITQTTLRGILLKVHGEMLAVPNLYIEHALKIDATLIKTVKTKPTVLIDNEILSLAKLSDILEIPALHNMEITEYNIVVLRHGSTKMAFIVDEICEEQEILIKKMGTQLQRIRNIAGATILGSGKIIPVLNVRDLFKSVDTVSHTLKKLEEKETEKAHVLLVEDSITSRMLIKNILEAKGYNVSTAVDGLAGLDFVKSEEVDLVISDVEMPRMNGFELTAAIRKDNKLSDLPVILVTSLSTQEDQQKGVDAGANAYIIKGSFDQSNLLESIERLI
jgi:two-component system, chemotaxis family, sensor kinase CheA